MDGSTENLGFIAFCQCAKIPPGGWCAKHGKVSEEDRLRRRASAAAFARLFELAKQLGSWADIEELVKYSIVTQVRKSPATIQFLREIIKQSGT